ncbi:GNAT family N-acetyltransferase [bacterium (Candidatus Blackallbacteria) CG17_big_fil_post_rev_8_21_14_2_50_48_46]|uniref:GNAT family N-acetyltransferase n=1 Tax=bacterium (Candidatus Blackallbacteria) CG17_big_fil_post_rev_8_21_14_2_50_48_46 TaxID=2014261 RepID=A0A2M7G183_9BACT|nr:MAG: GNAT family N-acetyltransferase [bacterium (Candidatus Blackallbacteria) CG18_big_fil_WC_8_21_14_2_50_49_26]PIW15482.1 MAG: GNAT family N-acetyltransferase [bacterium (Candidatus Blackallbacteria) CG17_big_fil_post_rev_8_21_14_2_50_48_46]PIW48618.1 MAG: GNAT family N-acetyltransferase [bacterium (Candidatus Blackallbacteria) CG13_big_fil_rev_8_21_14_2_50_49_14]
MSNPGRLSFEQIPSLLHSFAREKTPRLTFRPLTLSDAEGLFAIMSDPEVSRYNRWETQTTLAETQSYIQAVIDLYDQGQYLEWGIFTADHTLIGFFGFIWWLPEFASAEIGFSLGQSYWGKGYMQEALKALIDWGFKSMELNRFEAQCESRNLPSQKCLEKLGWFCEGLMRQKAFFKEEYHDIKLYSLLKSDPAF